ncbi:UDP-GlcNAc--UDP-phosphate GlcNAc-1-phosphate transferase [Tenacibaculum sp. MEBiC06402]|uniref:UDP-GlcNAc--UDP-phosphate GlcNAc-1-phosphate transferase n=1 Tax=unclassified Tenacibaculum TaxID=2635139 RepID=UPI003B99BD56
MNYLIIFLVLSALSFIYLKLADKFNIIDKPNHRSSHTVPTIRGGGILFYFGILIYFLLFGFKYPYFVIGVTLISIISFIDDIISLKILVRLPFQFLAIALSLYQVEIILDSGISFESFLVAFPLLFVGVAFINGYNFMDGINGITGFYSIVSLISLFAINHYENLIDSELLASVFISILVFGFYNFRKKARMFAGDIGSISMAVLIFFVAALLIYKTKAPVILLLVAVYSVDTILTMIHRKRIGEKLTEPHRKHIYQEMVHTLKMSHLSVSAIYGVLQLVINTVAFFTYKLGFVYQVIILLSVTASVIGLYLVGFNKIKKMKSSQ